MLTLGSPLRRQPRQRACRQPAGGVIAGKIVWAKGTQFGVQFAEKFDLKLLQVAAAPLPKGAKVMRPNYLSGDSSQAG